MHIANPVCLPLLDRKFKCQGLILIGASAPLPFHQSIHSILLDHIVAVKRLAGVFFKILTTGRFRYVSTAAYIVMGWVALIAIGPLVRSLSGLGTMWLALGGGLYTIGCVFYLWRGLPYSHPIWHLFVLAATICHFFCILWYVMA